MQKSHFRVVENGKFLNRLLNGHLEKSAATGFFTPHVHQRLRKCLARCTLDCGFKTSESPALRGFVAERAPIRGTSLYLVLKSNGLRHSKNPPVKFSFSLKIVPATIAKKLPPQRCFKPLLIPIFNFPHKRPTFAFTSESGYTHSALLKGSHTTAHTAKQGPSLPRPQHGLELLVKSPPKEQPEKTDARQWRVSAFSGDAAPLGCVIQ